MPAYLCGKQFAEHPVRDFAPLALSKGWKKLARLGAAAARPSVDQRRTMRRALKTFRHTVEFFASLHAESEVARFIKELKTLQDVLRHINEAATAQATDIDSTRTCPASQDVQRAAGYVLGRHDAQATRCASTLSKAWRRLEKRARFWT